MRRLALLLLVGCGRVGFDERSLVVTAPPRANLSTRVAIAVEGGAPPYSMSVTAGDGALDPAARLFRTAEHPGTATIEVRDASGDAASVEIATGGDYVYAIGGWDGAAVNDEVRRTTNGAEWELVGHLPTAREGGVTVVYDDQIFYIGGADMPDTTGHDDVWTTTDGVIWSAIGHLPQAVDIAGGAVFAGRIWVGGGEPGGAMAFTTDVWSSADGIRWTAEVPLPVPIHGTLLVPWRGLLWEVAGHESVGQTASIWSTDGTAWTMRGMVPVAGEYHGATIYNDHLWVAGGYGLQDRVVESPDGSSWIERTRIPPPRNWVHLIDYQGQLWALLGSPSDGHLTTDGITWQTTGNYPIATVLAGGLVQFTPHSP